MKRKTKNTIRSLNLNALLAHAQTLIGQAAGSLYQRWAKWRLRQPYPLQVDGEMIGAYGERIAAIYLQRKGYFILERSFRTRSGEIDIIAAWKRQRIVFVEVKTWAVQLEDEGGPSDAVTPDKEKKICQTSLIYMKKHRLLDQPGRFDVIQIVIGQDAGRPIIRHFENAFEAVGEFQMYS